MLSHARRLARPAAVAGARGPLRLLASSSSGGGGKPFDGGGAGKRRRDNFWAKWGGATQQEFWQDVGFDQDRRKEALRVQQLQEPRKGEDADGSRKPRALEEDEYFLTEDALQALDEEYEEYEEYGEEGGAASRSSTRRTARNAEKGPVVAPRLDTRAGAARAAAAREALYADADVPASRRAELLGLLEDLGPDGLQPLPRMPDDAAAEADGTELMKEDMSRRVLVSRSFLDSTALRERGMLLPGDYFGYLLNTRRVTKVGPEGKRMSYSCLVVVGNGRGSAGWAMGKDIQAGVALYKATREARKRLVHIDRFEDRTIFHPIEDRMGKSKLVIRLRRPGSGTRCSWNVWKVLSAFGISDISVKCHGSRNITGVTWALFNALQRMSTPQQLAESRGQRVLDFDPSQVNNYDHLRFPPTGAPPGDPLYHGRNVYGKPDQWGGGAPVTKLPQTVAAINVRTSRGTFPTKGKLTDEWKTLRR